jgi:SAM-dependent methyltransferase
VPTSTALNPPRCGACRSTNTSAVTPIPLYVRGGEVTTTIRRCGDCGTVFRDIDFNRVAALGHFDVASYTDPHLEQRLYCSRIEFLRWILRLAQNHLNRRLADMRVCDVGCAFGHMLDLVVSTGGVAVGVEIVDTLRARIAQRGLRTYRTVDEIPRAESFDAVLLIDSLYCFEDPAAVLGSVHGRLVPDGILILRVTNRTPALRLLRLLRVPLTSARLGDAKNNFSYTGICHLLTDSGYRIVEVRQHERGKRGQRPLTWLYYRLAPIAGWLTRRKLAPGLVLICRPSRGMG